MSNQLKIVLYLFNFTDSRGSSCTTGGAMVCPIVTRWNLRDSSTIIWMHPWMYHECLYFMAIHPRDVEILHWINENFDLLVALEEELKDTKVDRIHPLGTMTACTVVEMFQSGQKWWTDQRTDISVTRAMTPTWVKMDYKTRFIHVSPDKDTGSSQPPTETCGWHSNCHPSNLVQPWPGLGIERYSLCFFSKQSHVVSQHFSIGIGHVSDECQTSKRDIDPNHFSNGLRGHVLVGTWGWICLSACVKLLLAAAGRAANPSFKLCLPASSSKTWQWIEWMTFHCWRGRKRYSCFDGETESQIGSLFSMIPASLCKIWMYCRGL